VDLPPPLGPTKAKAVPDGTWRPWSYGKIIIICRIFLDIICIYNTYIYI
jgi:hypothetical protein